MKKESPETRFWKYVKRANEDQCWEWQGCLTKKGYGFLRVGRSTQLAHRFSWAIRYGSVPSDLCCLHRCDNPRCVNPNHIFLGTRKDNNEDRARKKRGRNGPQDGPNNNYAKLTWNQIDGMRHLRNLGVGQEQIALSFGIKQSTVSRIVRGLGWIRR